MMGFADSPTNTTREKARFCRFDGKNHTRVKIKNECSEEYFYSRETPTEAEVEFQNMEGDYRNFVRKLQSEKQLSQKEESALIFIIFTFHFRNPSYSNLTDDENIKRIHRDLNTFLEKEISEITNTKETDNIGTKLKGLQKNWRFKLVISHGEKFFTSDHPVIFFNLNKNGFAMAVLPLTPYLLGVAYDQRKIAIRSNEANARDVSGINAYIAVQSIAAVYSADKFSLEDQDKLKKIFKEKRRSQRGYSTEKELSIEYISYDKVSNQEFSFLEVK